MNFRSVCVACGLLLTVPVAGAEPDTLLNLQVGEVKVLAVPEVARVAVGDGHVLNAVTTEEKEVIVFARHEGSSTLQIWSANGRKHRYQVDVAPEGARQTRAELRTVLERIPNARVSVVGDKLVVEGDDLSDSDRERVAALSKRYPQLLDFTSQVGWDRMVLLDVQVVEVPRSQLQELGVRWNTASDGGLNAGLAWDGGSRQFSARPGESLLDLPFPARMAAGYFGINAVLSAQIRALAQTGSAVVLAQPQLLARSGATAEFLAGGEVPYSTVEANGATNTVFKPYGVSLRITPKIERNGAVRSRIEVEVSSVDQSLSVPNGPSLKTRRAATEFNVRSGQTLVLAGFLSREESRNTDKVPGLGDIPILGALFKSRRFQHNETELAIFVTPVVVAPDDPGLMQRVAQGRAILDHVFPDGELINSPVHAAARLPQALSASHMSWDPYSGAGSQWGHPESAPPLSSGLASPLPGVPPVRRTGVNQHDFRE
ncbi:pilus assembly protein N-terminal domain-containing protein [Paralcaligenes sp. KSB-10]|uniref:type II and III secretion system protein family protein n=1 Tax=Paralcaligenes sp. KSB-10 TaxID=2901142 RepID=UPI001E4C5370|nr:pilus assembly protein N-terminal domain-containing protein [Paralcaligenes sp. KSB-10]UHL65001.1 pilus assembly protein N-terminal domain-containing protein [Paralcaligenes sp. KSB-10]